MKKSLAISFCKAATVVLLALWMTPLTSAQNIQFTQGSVGSGLDNTIQIPVMGYPGRGASLPVTLYYSSRVWRLGQLGTVNDLSYYTTITEAIYAEHSTSGWKTSLDLPIIEWPKEEDQYYYTGKAFCFICSSGLRRFRVARVYIIMPDGSKHELRESDTPYEGALRVTGTFYAVDGSRLRYDSTSQTTGTLYMPDGSRYVLNGTTAQFIDRNGNTLNYNGTTRQWTDTLGRTIGLPFPAEPQATDYTYAPPGLRPDKPYIFRWRNLSTPGVITNAVPRKPVGSHYLPNPNQAPTNYAGNNYPQGWSDSLLVSWEADMDSPLTYVVGRSQNGTELFDAVVLTEVELPNGLKYKFSYNIYGEIDKVTYPTGAYEQYQFAATPPIGDLKQPYSQASRVVTQRQLSPKGDGSDLATWLYSVTGSSDPQIGGIQLITTTAPDNSYTEVRKHNFIAPQQPGQGNPRFWPFGWEDPRQGMPYEERVYDKPPAQGGVMLRRSLSDFAWTDNSIPPRIGLPGEQWVHAFRNARPTKSVNLTLDTGGDALAKLITYGYNSNPAYTLTTGLDRTDVAETHFASVPQASAQSDNIGTISTSYSFPPASSSVTTYLDDSNYRTRHILGLATSVMLLDAGAQVVSKSESFYDEAAYPLLTYGDLTGAGYNDPGTNARGNVTTARRYSDVVANLYLETHTQFDQCGSVRNSWNERGIQSSVEYSSTYQHAYATQATTAIPDPSGSHGSNTPFTSSSTFDYVAGLLLTTTDPNGQITTLSYQDDQGQQDPLNRLRKVIRPDGGWTKYSFGETLGNLFTLTETQQDATHVVKLYQYADPLGRASRSFVGEGGANYIASDTIYDQMGRVWKVSNPYRTTTLNGVADLSHTSDWTVSHYDALSRLNSVTLPDASQVLTSHQGIYTTVTDQAGRQRRQKTDALGRIVRVDEPNLSGILGTVDSPTQPTYYDYNTQGNLIHIIQGTGSGTIQHRYFKYDALGRLTYERQVEQTGTHSSYDALTGNSAWSRKLVYDEMIGGVAYTGLLTSAYDARNIRTEFRYDNLDRIWQVAYSDSTPTISNYYDQPATGYFNKGQLTQAVTAAVGSIPATAQTVKFDLMGRVANNQQTVGDQSYTMSYGYNLGGAMTSQTYPSGRVVNYAFDDAARLSAVSSGSTVYANQFDYSTTQGLLKSVTLGNGAVESFVYNSRQQMTSIDLTRSGTQIQHYDYKYGVYNTATNTVDETKNTGQIARIEGFIATAKQWQQNFAYDSLGRLSSAREFRGDNSQQVWLTNYEYDVFGNRYQKQAQNAGNPFTQIWTEDADINKNTNRYAAGLAYDDAGNVTVDSKFRNLSFQYDANNRQQQSSDGTTATVSVYDAGGQRVATMVSGTFTNVFVYDATGKLVAEYDSAPPASNGTQFVMSDHQDSPRVVTSSSGAVVSRHDYAPFGEELPAGIGLRASGQGYSQPDGIRKKYAGMETDPSGMNHTLWRRYDSLSARWTTPDPYGGSMTIAAPQSFNRYNYVENDPVNKVDPLGLMPMVDASMSYGDVSGLWAGGSLNFGGPETGRSIIAQAMHRIKTTIITTVTIQEVDGKGNITQQATITITETQNRYVDDSGKEVAADPVETTATAVNTGKGPKPYTAAQLETMANIAGTIVEVSRAKGLDPAIALGIAQTETNMGTRQNTEGVAWKRSEVNPMQLSGTSGTRATTDLRTNIALSIDHYNKVKADTLNQSLQNYNNEPGKKEAYARVAESRVNRIRESVQRRVDRYNNWHLRDYRPPRVGPFPIWRPE